MTGSEAVGWLGEFVTTPVVPGGLSLLALFGYVLALYVSIAVAGFVYVGWRRARWYRRFPAIALASFMIVVGVGCAAQKPAPQQIEPHRVANVVYWFEGVVLPALVKKQREEVAKAEAEKAKAQPAAPTEGAK